VTKRFDIVLVGLSRQLGSAFPIEPTLIDDTVPAPDLNSLMGPTAMDAGKILQELTYAEGLPKQALKAASNQRGETLRLFLEKIETYWL
jgi:hypothetical protein